MPPAQTEGRNEQAGKRPVVHCLVPRELAPQLHDLLRRHFRDDPGVEVLVERRESERRGGRDRRRAESEVASERRRAHDPAGRRVGERRVEVVPVAEPPELPRRARRHAKRLVFVERLEPAGQRAEDEDTARLVVRWQAGDREVFATLYSRYFDRVFSYLRLLVPDRDEAEDTAQEVFARALEALPRYERRGRPFRAWLFRIARNCGIEVLRRSERFQLMDPDEIARRVEADGADEEADEGADEEADEATAQVLDWLTDRDLSLFVERLPVPQRQVLTMRYLFDMTGDEIAAKLGRTPGDVRKLQSRGLDFLRDRLAAVGRKSSTAKGRLDRPITRVNRQAPVIRSRRFSLDP